MARTRTATINKSATSILLGDPSRHSRAMLSEILRNLGYHQIHMAGTGAEVLDGCRTSLPKVLILENLLPDEPGVDLVHRMRREDIVPDRSIPVIMITSDPRIETVKQARMSGIDEFACKPISHNAIAERLEEVLVRPRPFIEAKMYVGPCRRRKRKLQYQGAMRRLVDPDREAITQHGQEKKQEMLSQCVEHIDSIAETMNPNVRAEVKSLFSVAEEALRLAGELRDEPVRIAGECLSQYIQGVGASGDLQRSVVQTHISAIRHLLSSQNAGHNQRLAIAEGLRMIVSRKLHDYA